MSNNDLAVFALLFLCLTIAAVCLLSPLLRRRVKLDKLAPDADPMSPAGDDMEDWQNSVRDFVSTVGKTLARSGEGLTQTRQRLIQAGYRSRDTAFVFTGVRMILAFAAMFVSFILLRQFTANFLFLVIFAGLIGLILPDLWLRNRVKNRQRKVVWALPDFMDLLLVCVEAGLGLDQALARVGKSLQAAHPDISAELRIYGLEINAGSSRAQSLRNFASRTGVDELRSFAAMLIQADRFGTSLGRTLRVFSEDLRIRRRQAAEEAAAKLTVKLVIPLVVFIFPAILAVTAGPAVIAIIRTLFGTLSRGG